MRLARPLRALLTTFLTLTATPLLGGCYMLADVEHNHAVAGQLEPGQSLDAALETLGQGAGRVELESEVERPLDGDWAAALKGLQLETLEAFERDHGPVQRFVEVRRFWGLRGFGVFHLGFDANGELLAHRLVHYN